MSELNNCFKEAVCAEVQRVFDSCSDRDCIYELPITLTEESSCITDDLDVVRTRCAEVEVTCISVDAVPFKSGYYAVDITYRFKITAEAFSHNCCKSQSGTVLCGTALWNKRVILYGSDGNAKIFTSEQDLTPSSLDECDVNSCCCARQNASMPKATVRVLDPIALEAKFKCVPTDMPDQGVCQSDFMPPCPCDCCYDEKSGGGPKPPHPRPRFKRVLTVSLGLFSIVQLSIPVSIIVPSYDYCIPCKDCSGNATEASEAPCDVFDRIEFPADQFFPQASSASTKYGNCCESANTASDTGCECDS